MVSIRYRPILWHVMKYYAHYGHKDFILCLGYKADVIKNYFLKYDECVSNDFVLSKGGKNLELLSSDIDDWRITFVDTGLNANIGERLRAVENHLQNEEVFLANYTDGLSDVDLNVLVDSFLRSNRLACFVSVKPRASFHMIAVDGQGVVKSIEHITKSGGAHQWRFLFILTRGLSIHQGGRGIGGRTLPSADIRRAASLPRTRQLLGACMDTFKDRQELEDLYRRGSAPWTVWNGHR